MHTTKNSTDLKLYSDDSSIFKILPELVAYPEKTQDIQDIVKLATSEQKVISVRSGGTCMSGGSLTSGIMIDMKKHMNKIEILPYSKSITVEMGAYFRDIEKVASINNLMFAPYPSSKDICGIGGMIGNNASGEKSVRHGGTIDNVHAVKVVLHDGNVYDFEEISEKQCAEIAKQNTVIGHIYKTIREIYRTYGVSYKKRVGDVKKSASGYRLEHIYDQSTKTWNLAKLFVGSQATLGVIVSARLKLVPIPLYTRVVLIPIDELACLPKILQTVMRHHPECVETFDVNTWRHAKQFLPEDTIRVGEYFAHGEKLVVLIQFSEDNQTKTDTLAHTCVKSLTGLTQHASYISDPALVQSLWNIRRSSFRVLRDAVYDSPTKKPVPCIEDIIVPISRYDIFIPKLIEIFSELNIEFGFHGHIGDGALRVIPIVDFADKTHGISVIKELCTRVFSLIKELDGNISADHGDGIIRTPFLREFYGDVLYDNVILGIKHLFDPHGVFNSDKKEFIHTNDWLDMLKW